MRGVKRILLAVSVTFLFCGCAAASTSTLHEMADQIVAGVGQVLDLREGDPDRVIFVFEERHDSVLVQLEMAIMLNRLYADHGLRFIGLEGLTTDESPLDLSWAHWCSPYRPDRAIAAREDVIVHTLFEGNSRAVELLGLIYEDVVVAGIDDAELYAVQRPREEWSAPFTYLYGIALAGMDTSEYSTWKEIYDEGDEEEAYRYAMSTDPPSLELDERLRDEIDMTSAEEMLEILSLLRSRASRVHANLSDVTAAQLDALEDYMQVVSRRTEAMATSMLDLASSLPGVPLAVNIGAMHSERMMDLFADSGVSCVAVRTLAQAEGSTVGLLSAGAVERRVLGLPAYASTLTGALSGSKNPVSLTPFPFFQFPVAFGAGITSLTGMLTPTDPPQQLDLRKINTMMAGYWEDKQVPESIHCDLPGDFEAETIISYDPAAPGSIVFSFSFPYSAAVMHTPGGFALAPPVEVEPEPLGEVRGHVMLTQSVSPLPSIEGFLLDTRRNWLADPTLCVPMVEDTEGAEPWSRMSSSALIRVVGVDVAAHPTGGTDE